MKYNLYKLIAVFAIVSTLLAACGGGAPAATEPATKEPAATQPAANGPAKISVFVGFGAGSDPDSMEALKKIADEFNASHKDIQMEFTFSTWEEHSSKFSTLLAGGLAPDLACPIGIQGIAEFYDEWIDVSSATRRHAI